MQSVPCVLWQVSATPFVSNFVSDPTVPAELNLITARLALLKEKVGDLEAKNGELKRTPVRTC